MLGLQISSDVNIDSLQENYIGKIDKLQSRLNPWLQKGLTPYGKVYLVKSVALSQLTYAMSVLPQPKPDLIKRIEDIIFQFIWGKKRARVKKDILKREYKKGGLKVPDVQTVSKSLKIAWVKRYLDVANRAKWKKVVSPILTLGEGISIFHCNAEEKQIQKYVKNMFWREVAVAWQEINRKDIQTPGDVLNEVIWLNRNINIERHPGISRKLWIEKGVVQINDLYDSNSGQMFTANDLATKIGVHPILCQSLIKTIPRSWREALGTKEQVTEVDSKGITTVLEKAKVVRWAYLELLPKSETIPVACDKWQDELELSGTYNWDDVFNRVYVVSDDRNLRWFQFQCLHRFLPTNKRLYMYGLSDTNKCRSCPMYQESISHLFWHCQCVALFWRQIKEAFRIDDLSIDRVILGVGCETCHADRLNLLILLAKKFIWSCRVSERPVTFQTFISQLQEYSRVEKHVAQINDKLGRYKYLWKTMNEVIGRVFV